MLHDEAIHFTWPVAEDGYQWLEITPESGEGPTNQYLTDKRQSDGTDYWVRRYNPLTRHSGLFRTFADLTPEPSAILAFANTYGRLGGEAAEIIWLPLPSEAGAKLKGEGETPARWRSEIESMRHAVRLWQYARSGDVENLADCIVWKGPRDVRYDSEPSAPPDQPRHQAVIANDDLHADLLDRFTSGDLIEPALYYLQRLTNRHLAKAVSPRLLWTEDRQSMRLCIMPESLRDALWLQFARAVERNAELHDCAQCGTWFEVTAKGRRRSRLYCSDACRTKAYRARKEAATPDANSSGGSRDAEDTAAEERPVGRPRLPEEDSGPTDEDG